MNSKLALAQRLCARRLVSSMLLTALGCAKNPPLADGAGNGPGGKPFSDETASVGGSSGDAGTCQIFTCRYIAVGSPACADYYAEDGWTQADAAKDCKAAAAFVKTSTVDASPQPSCIHAGAAKDDKIGGVCFIKGAMGGGFEDRKVYAYGMTEGLCTGIKDLHGEWHDTAVDPCPQGGANVGDASFTPSGDASTDAAAPIYSCRYSEGLGSMRCADYPSVAGFTEDQAKGKCDEKKGVFSSDASQACIAGGYTKRCALTDKSYVYNVDSCDGLFGVLELVGVSPPPESAPFPPYGSVACGTPGSGDQVFTCRYQGFAPSCADYPEKEGWTEETATAHCKTLPNSSDHQMGGPTCLEDSAKKSDATRCKIADPAVCDQVYYGYDIPDFVCTGGLIAGKTEQEKPPFADY